MFDESPSNVFIVFYISHFHEIGLVIYISVLRDIYNNYIEIERIKLGSSIL